MIRAFYRGFVHVLERTHPSVASSSFGLLYGVSVRVGEVRGAGRRKKDAASEREHAAPPTAPNRPAAPSMGGGEDWHHAATITDVAPFAAENPLHSQRDFDDSLGTAAPALVVAQAGRQRHESTGADDAQARKRGRSDAEEELRNRARTIFNASQGPSAVPAEPQRRSPGGGSGAKAAAQVAAL